MNIVIFGTGTYYVHWKERLKKEYNIIAFTDNNKSKQDSMFEGLPVIAPNKLVGGGDWANKYDKIVIASSFKYEIFNQLLDMGVQGQKIDFLPCFSLCYKNQIGIEIEEENRSVIFNLNGMKYRCKYKSDFVILADTYEGNYNFNLNRDAIVIDIGMNIGITTLFFAEKKYIKKVYGFEPFQETYQQALDNIKLNNSEITKKIKTYQIGLGKEDARKAITYYQEYSGGMSTVKESHDIIPSNKITWVNIKNATPIIEQIIDRNPNNVIILKSDCEGSEYDIFESFEENRLLNKIDVIALEWHPGNIFQLEKYLYKNNFIYTKSYTTPTFGFIYAFNMNLNCRYY